MHAHPENRNASHGFTLIELLVVLTVIALLMSILLPQLANARESGHAVVCASQMDQIFNASFIYAQDFDQRLPYFAWKDGRPYGEEWWVTQIVDAMNNEVGPPRSGNRASVASASIRGAYACPSDDNPNTEVRLRYFAGIYRMSQDFGGFNIDITYRGSCDLVERVSPGSEVFRARKITSWERPSEGLLMLEADTKTDAFSANPEQRECFRFSDLASLSDRFRSHQHQESWERHNFAANYLFLDGHVEMLRPGRAALLANVQEHYLY